jgi:hypothetical protein
MNMGVAKRRRVDKNCVVHFRDKIIAWTNCRHGAVSAASGD